MNTSIVTKSISIFLLVVFAFYAVTAISMGGFLFASAAGLITYGMKGSIELSTAVVIFVGVVLQIITNYYNKKLLVTASKNIEKFTNQFEQTDNKIVNRLARMKKGEKQIEGFANSKGVGYPSARNSGHEGFRNIEGDKFALPDYDKLEEEEKKILATYKPKNSKDLLQYSIEDSEELIKKIYDSKGLVPSYNQRPDGIWEVYETMEKNPKIVWEDEVNVERYAGEEVRGLAPVGSIEQTINVPTYPNTLAAGLDPFFEPRTSLRPGRNDYTRWTPGLERMFAPTNEAAAWY